MALRLLCPAGLVTSSHWPQYFHRVFAFGMRLRSAVMASVYNKALILSTSAKQKTTTGEIVNLMAVDAQVGSSRCLQSHFSVSLTLVLFLALSLSIYLR